MFQIGSLIWDYKGASDSDIVLDNLNNYAEFCPCAIGCECLAPYITVQGSTFTNGDATVIFEPKPPLSGTAYYQYVITINCDTQGKTCIKALSIDWNGSDPTKYPMPLWGGSGWATGGTVPINISPTDTNGQRITVESYSVNTGSVTVRFGSIRRWGQAGNYIRVNSFILGETVNA
jgi:hypothetical protein